MKISVGGMIASGKSTLVERLGAYLELPILEEFEEEDEVFNTILKWLYEGKPDVEMLLQIYFIHQHYLKQKQFGHSFIVDRDLIEHWLFAHKNLVNMPEVMNMYNGVFMAYMNQITKPDLYIILDVSFSEFLSRIKSRGRDAEIDNLEQNYLYFKNLHKDYVDKLKAQCNIYDIPYVVIDTNDKTIDDITLEAIKHIERLEGYER